MRQPREAQRMERPARAIDEAFDAELFGLRRVLAAQRLHPARRQLRAHEVEVAGIQHQLERHIATAGLDDARIAIERAQHRAGAVEGGRIGQVGLADDDHIGELDLLHQQVDQPALVVVPGLQAAVGQALGRAEVAQEADPVDHGEHGVQARDVGQAAAIGVAHGEGRRHRHRLGNAGGFDQQVVVAPALGQALHLLAQVVAQGAADAAVAELDQGLFGATERGAAVADQRRVDVDLAHVVDDHRHPAPIAVVQHAVEQGGLAGAQEAGQHGDGEAAIGNGGVGHGGHRRGGVAGWKCYYITLEALE
ncbi:hypothetical protein NB689_003512 [Xanthomonas sacchari]|nr:hypothetical protein [Xanthomonas sacchari]